ncbi:ATP-dependent (S)-NAD(P)H-hydrate dehydratase [Ceratobasidium theobromae]|uniref:ATP-dependent (S)-NAD(P)H-hydrate dehydratase n=1 Tax=Ceratobasidium theobromae TaxID=1582974 RepID=A0A5N5QJ14_9AGAM|nr:ATP-dependent (S)-NAD(P)H-hydrate dehydratase [Ceratobasidium theobromae]
MANQALLKQIKQIIPPLSPKLHKGQAGRVGVIGGSQDYTGAPYFSSISALRLGCDLSHVICEPGAGAGIKTYSPDLIVHPILNEKDTPDSIKSKLESIVSRLHVLVIGPGLGREEHMQNAAKVALQMAKEKGMYVVIDADGLYLVQNEPDVVKGNQKAVLTPNVVEFERLCKALKVDIKGDPSSFAPALSKALGGVTIIQKGPADIIVSGDQVEEINEPGGLKRCGGQGDILSGMAGTFLAWGKSYVEGGLDHGDAQSEGERIPEGRVPLLAAAGASILTRAVSRLAFEKLGRGVITGDMIGEIGTAYAAKFGEQGEKGWKGAA